MKYPPVYILAAGKYRFIHISSDSTNGQLSIRGRLLKQIKYIKKKEAQLEKMFYHTKNRLKNSVSGTQHVPHDKQVPGSRETRKQNASIRNLHARSKQQISDSTQ
jgi:hypothetical protein